MPVGGHGGGRRWVRGGRWERNSVMEAEREGAACVWRVRGRWGGGVEEEEEEEEEEETSSASA